MIKFGPVFARASFDVFVTSPATGTGALVKTMGEAREYAALLLSNDPKREAVTISYREYCAACEGSGRKGRTRDGSTSKPCKACGGRGQLFEVALDRVTRMMEVE